MTSKSNILRLAVIFIFSLFGLFWTFTVLANDTTTEKPEDKTKTYGITFPIESLGGCANLAKCKTYCENPLHHQACIDFAKSKGFYKEEKKHNSSANQVENKSKSEILEKAKQLLGCDSYESCKAFCQQPTNKQKCSEFSRIVGLGQSKPNVGPENCTSLETCRTYCANHRDVPGCLRFLKPDEEGFKENQGKANYEKYCKENPEKCHQPTPTAINKEEFCRKYPDRCQNYRDLAAQCKQKGCTWTDSICHCPNNNEVKGTSIRHNLFQIILDFLLTK